ncbi:hypothetical protein GCM10027614_36860 [Micromonospora vulcania]
MIDRQQAEQLAAVWAQRDSLRLGYVCTPAVDEFDLGYVISSTVSSGAKTIPGDLPTTVVDKQTGEVTTWPRVPTQVVADLYRRSRPEGPAAPRTVDPETRLLRDIRRLPTPDTVAQLSVAGQIFTAQGAKGDVPLRHHPLVQAYLDGLPAGELVRWGRARRADRRLGRAARVRPPAGRRGHRPDGPGRGRDAAGGRPVRDHPAPRAG